MNEALKLLSFQTFTSAEYTGDYDPDLQPSSKLPNKYINVAPTETPVAPVAQPTAIAPSLSLVPDNQNRVSVVQHALKTSVNKDKLYLAEACGNCARAYGLPLVCALITEPIEPLSCCDLYLSPFNLPAA